MTNTDDARMEAAVQEAKVALVALAREMYGPNPTEAQLFAVADIYFPGIAERAEAETMTDIKIRVHPPTVPTTAAPFHPRATHADALGMPVAFTTPNPDWPEDKPWPYHPTPCCGASASISDGPMYCKACYEEVDPAYGNAPLEPFRVLGPDEKGER